MIRINDINEKNTQNKLTALHAMRKNPACSQFWAGFHKNKRNCYEFVEFHK